MDTEGRGAQDRLRHAYLSHNDEYLAILDNRLFHQKTVILDPDSTQTFICKLGKKSPPQRFGILVAKLSYGFTLENPVPHVVSRLQVRTQSHVNQQVLTKDIILQYCVYSNASPSAELVRERSAMSIAARPKSDPCITAKRDCITLATDWGPDGICC